MTFISVNPAGNCNSTCTGGSNGTATDTITANFTFTEPNTTNPACHQRDGRLHCYLQWQGNGELDRCRHQWHQLHCLQ